MSAPDNMMIVTIDGPSGSGKSTAAKTLAARLGFEFLDTGAMFRAVALGLLRAKVDLEQPAAITAYLPNIHLDLRPGQVWLNGEEVTASIRTPEVTAASSRIAVVPAVRAFLAEQQRRLAQNRDIICEGRDQGTVVFPEAACKFFLTADPRVRAQRRFGELHRRGEQTTLEDILQAQEERDRRDTSRALAPLAPARDARVVDTTHLSLDEVMDRLEHEIRQCRAG